MTAFIEGPFWSAAAPFMITDDDSVPIWGRDLNSSFCGETYYWEGRQLVQSGHALLINPPVTGMSLRITGYQLSVG